ncbi:hypothetical protein P154DRAFT_574347 [Amniculicola lignicola CBS 123094]|uniref:Uncharacterized protein n=1 Tax=Amniculicola lignicola CBS 123094 TaxID=1392246 RepID=A0A6A5WPC7_9PLEO|nr:hypothetical protein P154DRAFT_574347 [Amniculicola lignicola CBS 123094]
MGSKLSKVKDSVHVSHGKLQPSVNRSDKEEMKEPPNYYSHRSKSMRRKAKGDTPKSSPLNSFPSVPNASDKPRLLDRKADFTLSTSYMPFSSFEDMDPRGNVPSGPGCGWSIARSTSM